MKVFEALIDGISIVEDFLPILETNEEFKKSSEKDREAIAFLYFICIACGYNPKTSTFILQKAANVLGQINAEIQIKAAQQGLKQTDLDNIAKMMLKAKDNGFDVIDFMRKIKKINPNKEGYNGNG